MRRRAIFEKTPTACTTVITAVLILTAESEPFQNWGSASFSPMTGRLVAGLRQMWGLDTIDKPESLALIQ